MKKTTLFTQDQENWIKEKLKTYASFELLPILNEKFKKSVTEKQFKNWRANHKVCGVRKARNARKSKFPVEVIDFIIEHKNDYEAPYMAELIKKNFNYEMTANQVKGYKANHKLGGILTGAWNEHRPNPHKGMKGWCIKGSEKTRFKKGDRPAKTVTVGTIRQRIAHGTVYSYIKVEEPSKWILYETYLMEQKLGRKLDYAGKGEKVKFLDGNTQNFELDNLMLIDNKTLLLLNQKGRCTNDKELTRAGVLLTQLEEKMEEKKNNGNSCKK